MGVAPNTSEGNLYLRNYFTNIHLTYCHYADILVFRYEKKIRLQPREIARVLNVRLHQNLANFEIAKIWNVGIHSNLAFRYRFKYYRVSHTPALFPCILSMQITIAYNAPLHLTLALKCLSPSKYIPIILATGQYMWYKINQTSFDHFCAYT